MRVNNDSLLWLTRGKSWGFRYLSEPSGLPSVEAIHKYIFLKDESRIGYWKGIIFEKWHYVACRCYDDQTLFYDEAGRRIPHEFLILCSPEEQHELADLQWGPLVIEKTRDYYLQQYDSENPEFHNCKIGFDLVAATMTKNEDECAVIDVPFACIQNEKDSLLARRRFKRTLLLFLLMFLCAGCVLCVYYCWSKKQQNKGSTRNEQHVVSAEPADANPDPMELVNDSLTDSIASDTDNGVSREDTNLLQEQEL